MKPSTGDIIDRLSGLGTSGAESFFIEHGLGQAFAKPDRGRGVRKRVNEALLAAEREGRLEEVLRAARARFFTAASESQAAAGGTNMTRVRTRRGKLFVPHAFADRELADAVADLLRLGTDLTSKTSPVRRWQGWACRKGRRITSAT